jgi:NADPH-dependent 2,4-dienoyl-CoA reductase/sulfur reductase-like enzyme
MSELKRVVIVGGVAGGMSTATRLRRLSNDLEIIVLERSNYVSYANCGLPYYVGGVIEKESSLLLQTPESLHSRFR